MDYTYALAMTVALSLLVVALQAWGLRRKAIDRSARDTKRDRVRKAKDDDFPLDAALFAAAKFEKGPEGSFSERR